MPRRKIYDFCIKKDEEKINVLEAEWTTPDNRRTSDVIAKWYSVGILPDGEDSDQDDENVSFSIFEKKNENLISRVTMKTKMKLDHMVSIRLNLMSLVRDILHHMIHEIFHLIDLRKWINRMCQLPIPKVITVHQEFKNLCSVQSMK